MQIKMLAALVLIFGCSQAPQRMTAGLLDATIRTVGTEVANEQNVWQFKIHELPAACIIDTGFDRMRIIIPITETSNITNTQMQRMLAANFHTALDVRYGSDRGMLYAAFIHPLSPLTEDELRSALQQVYTLAATFGTEYTSGVLSYGQSDPGI